MPPLSPITQALLLANVALFCLDFFVGRWLIGLFALWPFGGGFMPWQVVTYSFLHGGLGHLFFNMLGLWMFGCRTRAPVGAAALPAVLFRQRARGCGLPADHRRS